MINVTKTFLPPQEEYQDILKRAWDSGWMTNRGVLVKELEQQLKSYLGVNQMIAMTNGTLPLQIAIKALNLHGEIITTPFSYVATTSSIVWEGCTPVFVDIHPEYLTIDETKIEAAITDKTTAILATHVFGNPCAIDEIEIIAKKYNLKVIYDAAHCFGVTYKEESIFNYGDVSTCSFHSTKLFHTGEGGALFCNDEDLYNSLYYNHNFGHDGPLSFFGLGINAKMSELQGAMGLSLLPYLNKIFDERRKVIDFYNEAFKNLNLRTLKIRTKTNWNFSYYPVVLDSEATLLKVEKVLNIHNIYPRRYFYPSLNKLPFLEYVTMENSELVASKVLCLPLYVGLTQDELALICKLIIENL